jgi:hypothetical protein
MELVTVVNWADLTNADLIRSLAGDSQSQKKKWLR